MPALPGALSARLVDGLDDLEAMAGLIQREAAKVASHLVKRVNITINSTTPSYLIGAESRDPWAASGKYGLGFVYFALILLLSATLLRVYHLFSDRVRTALYKEEVSNAAPTTTSSPSTDYELSAVTDKSTNKFFPRVNEVYVAPKTQSGVSSIAPLNNLIALFRFVFYRPIPVLRLRKRKPPVIFPSLAVSVIVFAALVFTLLYSFLPQPLFWRTMEMGSPPLAIRAGMLAVAMVPWIIALSMKANAITFMTGIGHERLNVLHRWGGYVCLVLAVVHTIPFYIQPIWDDRGYQIYKTYFATNTYIYTTGIAALGPLIFLCVHSLPILRRKMYELFVVLHVPVSIVFFAMLFWHCHNYLTSWNYLYSTLAIWLSSYMVRLFFLNWTNPWRFSWLIGDEAAVTLMPENAVKVTIPTQMKWQPGQYVYLRMPGISVFENHPFTIASLCSDDFPSEYGPGYRDMVLVFRPYGGFTRKVLRSAIEHGPWHTYRAFIDGPYGGMNRRLDSFDHVILFAGGSGVTALVSHLLDLIKRMRDGKAVTKRVQVVWALKRPETMEWFKEELRICRENAPPDAIQCQFYITTAKRQAKTGQIVSAHTPTRIVSTMFKDKVNNTFQDIAAKRLSGAEGKRNSALIMQEAQGDPEREMELRMENEDAVSALPRAEYISIRSAPPAPAFHRPNPYNGHHSQSANPYSSESSYHNQSSELNPQYQQQQFQHTPFAHLANDTTAIPQPVPAHMIQGKRQVRNLSLDISAAVKAGNTAVAPEVVVEEPQKFDFGFPSTPTEFQKNLMRFAFLPAAVKKKDGWSTEYGRPDIPYMLRQFSKDFGRRTCVYVCGPPSMRIDVSNTVAELQRDIWQDANKDELFLHTENYAI